MSNRKIKFVNDNSGDELEELDVVAALDETIKELQRLLIDAVEFRTKMGLGQLTNEDTFLDFTDPLSNGYDRTGPGYVSVEEEE